MYLFILFYFSSHNFKRIGGFVGWASIKGCRIKVSLLLFYCHRQCTNNQMVKPRPCFSVMGWDYLVYT